MSSDEQENVKQQAGRTERQVRGDFELRQLSRRLQIQAWGELVQGLMISRSRKIHAVY